MMSRCKTKKDHRKNDDIWREANIEPMTLKLHTTEMRMLRRARGKTKKDHSKNEDIWTMERSQHRTGDNLPRKETTEMVCKFSEREEGDGPKEMTGQHPE